MEINLYYQMLPSLFLMNKILFAKINQNLMFKYFINFTGIYIFQKIYTFLWAFANAKMCLYLNIIFNYSTTLVRYLIFSLSATCSPVEKYKITYDNRMEFQNIHGLRYCVNGQVFCLFVCFYYPLLIHHTHLNLYA